MSNVKTQFKKGHIPWNLNLTKEVDRRVAKSAKSSSKTRKKLYTKGKLKVWCTGLTKKTDRRLAKMGEKHSMDMKRKYEYGYKVWNIGLTKETDERVAKYSRKGAITRIGKFVGHPCYNPNGWGKCGFREDLNHTFKSTYEANLARILNYLDLEWDYEICRFKFDDCSYLPDFYLPQFDMWIEVKGNLTSIGKYKLEKMNKFYPNENIKIIDGEVYKRLISMFKNKIALWES